MSTPQQQQGRIAVVRLESQALENNPLGDPNMRELFIYLPPSYDEDAAQRFPVVYCLTGFTGRGRMMLNDNAFSPNIAQRMDRLVASGECREMILVMPDCFTRYGGSQYMNSTATGDYEDYLVQEIVPFVDQHFRTIPDAGARGVMGKSSGGYGALRLGMLHADVFSAVASHAGDCLFEYSYLPDFPKAVRAMNGDPQAFIERFWKEEKKGKFDVPTLNIIAMSACYSPDASAPLGFRFPFDLTTGELDDKVWQQWLKHDPVRMLPRALDNLFKLKLIYLDAGTRDEFALDLGARVLAERLKYYKIDFTHEEFDDGHMNISYRYDRSLPLISAALKI